MTPDIYWIPGPWRGKLAIVARPRGGDWLQDEIKAFHRAGTDIIVSLLEEQEALQLGLALEPAAAESEGVEFISHPIPDRNVPASAESTRSLLKSLIEKLDDGKNIALHCRQSVGRSGLIAAGLLLTSGTDLETAIRVIGAARGVAIPETATQLRWLEHLRDEQLLPVA